VCGSETRTLAKRTEALIGKFSCGSKGGRISSRGYESFHVLGDSKSVGGLTGAKWNAPAYDSGVSRGKLEVGAAFLTEEGGGGAQKEREQRLGTGTVRRTYRKHKRKETVVLNPPQKTISEPGSSWLGKGAT